MQFRTENVTQITTDYANCNHYDHAPKLLTSPAYVSLHSMLSFFALFSICFQTPNGEMVCIKLNQIKTAHF